MDPIEPTPKSSPYIIPASIIVAGAFVAGAIFYANKPAPTIQPAKTVQQKIVPVPPVSATEHILGNPEAPIVMVEYSDTDCPYCQMFDPTLKRIMSEYGKNGSVARVYRHFPIHPKVPYEAQATECAAELGGNDMFWKYTDLLFSKKDFHQNPYLGVDPADLPKLAASLGLNQTAFTTCLTSGKYADKVSAQYKEATEGGGSGTPFTVFVLKNQISEGAKKILAPVYAPYTDQNGNPLVEIADDGLSIRMSGALPYEALKSTIDTLLKS